MLLALALALNTSDACRHSGVGVSVSENRRRDNDLRGGHNGAFRCSTDARFGFTQARERGRRRSSLHQTELRSRVALCTNCFRDPAPVARDWEPQERLCGVLAPFPGEFSTPVLRNALRGACSVRSVAQT